MFHSFFGEKTLCIIQKSIFQCPIFSVPIPVKSSDLNQSGILYNTQQHTTFYMCVTCVLYLKTKKWHVWSCVWVVYTYKKDVCKSCVFSKKYSQKWPFITKSFVLSTHILPFFIFFASNDRNLDVQISCSVHGCSKLPKNMTALVFLVQIV